MSVKTPLRCLIIGGITLALIVAAGLSVKQSDMSYLFGTGVVANLIVFWSTILDIWEE